MNSNTSRSQNKRPWGKGRRTKFCFSRSGLSLWNTKVFEDVEKYARLKQLGFNELVSLSESPYHNAIQIVNPGQTDIPCIMVKSHVTPLVEK